MSSAEKLYEPYYLVEDYLGWDGEWELWNGLAVSMSPAPSPQHQLIESRLVAKLHNALEESNACKPCVVLAETDWRISKDTVVRPDVLLTCEPLPEKHIMTPPVFVAEIASPSTAVKDRTAKRSLYESQGVRYFLLIDPASGQIEFLENQKGSFKYSPLQDGAIRLELNEKCQVTVDLAAIAS